jgi:long-chain fatty acid transport protein
MKVALRFLCLLLCLALIPTWAFATNGDDLIGVGSVSRSMGGVGIASPQDAVSAVFSNPASMCFGGFCPSSQADFMGSVFTPHVKATITNGSTSTSADAKEKAYTMPALGISFDVPELPNLRFGLGAYGVTGMGVDYRGTSLDKKTHFYGAYPLASGTYTYLGTMKFAPSVAYQLNDWMSVGAALHVDYSTLDLGSGESAGYGAGGQLGLIVKPLEQVSLGLTYTNAQSVKYEKVSDFDGDGTLDNLKLASPQKIGFGVSYSPLANLLLETDVKWVNWSDADGYKDFDWGDQWVFNFGLQYKIIPALALRAGYNYGKNPVKKHSINGSQTVTVQGKQMSSYYYESFRIVGFPAIAEHHITCGLGYDLTDKITMTAGYMHAFGNSITETGTDITGAATSIKSTMSEDSYEVGLSWRF